MKAAKITGGGEREVRKYLTAELGPSFCPSQRRVEVVITLNKSPIFLFTDEQLGTFFFRRLKSDFFHLPTTNTPIHRYNLLNLTLLNKI
jgi:hypothetical protein